MSHCWKDVLVNPDTTLCDALKVIDSGGLRIALVVDGEGKLKGIVTDGDIRRGLLENYSLSTNISLVMNTNPVVVEVRSPKELTQRVMKDKGILSVPVLDEGKVVGLELFGEVSSSTKKQNPIFIMAGGFGKRLKPLTDNCPKPMLKVGDKPILETLVRSFIKAGFENFYISTHYMPEQIQAHFGDGSDLGVSITYVHESVPLGTGGALGMLPEDLPKDLPLIMINGDVLTKVDFNRLLEFHNTNSSDATMCVREYDYQIPYGVINGEGNNITKIVEKPTHRYFVNAGIYVISPKIYKSIPQNHYIDMPTLFEQHVECKDNILMFPLYEYWLDIGRMDDFNRAQQDIKSLELD